MDIGKLYFVKDGFYERFSGWGLLENKEMWEKKPLVYMYNHYRTDKDENK